jgi:phosphate-selective porin
VGPGAQPAPCRAQIPLKAYYQDDFVLETEGGAFQLRIRGNLHVDTRLYQGENLGAVQNIDIRRARIDLMGRIHRRFTFRIQPELSGAPYVRNAWADWEFSPALHLKWGQMKVPFSSSWLTLDNNVNFVERGSASPVHPFFDRGFTFWGEVLKGTVTYDLGVYTGVGVEADVPSGDVDSGKEWAARFFLRPFLNREDSELKGLILVLGGTWAGMSVPTARIETGGLPAANAGSALWRWRTEQLLGTDGRVTDRVAAEIDTRRRLGAELHYLRGPLALSSELLEVRYRDVALYHDFFVGSTRTAHLPVQERSGSVRSWSTWASYYLTGESKRLEDAGWRTARPMTAWGEDGPGAWEVLGRYSRTWSDRDLFDAVRVTGFVPEASGLPPGYGGATPGAGNSVTASVLDGAHEVNEVTLGLSWTVNPMVRIQLNDVFLWAPSSDRTGDGVNDNLLVSGALTAQSNPDLKFRRSEWENAVMLRFIFKL